MPAPVYIKKVYPNSEIKLYKGADGHWYGGTPRGWRAIPERAYPKIIKALEEAAKKGHSSQTFTDGVTTVTYLLLSREEAAMILFQVW